MINTKEVKFSWQTCWREVHAHKRVLDFCSCTSDLELYTLILYRVVFFKATSISNSRLDLLDPQRHG